MIRELQYPWSGPRSGWCGSYSAGAMFIGVWSFVIVILLVLVLVIGG